MARMGGDKAHKAPDPRRGGDPPEASRWAKGCASPNPGGRPKKGQDLRSLVGQELDGIVEINEGGRIVSLSKRAIVAKQLVKKAMQGDIKAIDRVMDYDREAPTEASSSDCAAADLKASEAILAAMHPPPVHQDIPAEPTPQAEVADNQLMLPLFDL